MTSFNLSRSILLECSTRSSTGIKENHSIILPKGKALEVKRSNIIEGTKDSRNIVVSYKAESGTARKLVIGNATVYESILEKLIPTNKISRQIGTTRINRTESIQNGELSIDDLVALTLLNTEEYGSDVGSKLVSQEEIDIPTLDVDGSSTLEDVETIIEASDTDLSTASDLEDLPEIDDVSIDEDEADIRTEGPIILLDKVIDTDQISIDDKDIDIIEDTLMDSLKDEDETSSLEDEIDLDTPSDLLDDLDNYDNEDKVEEDNLETIEEEEALPEIDFTTSMDSNVESLTEEEMGQFIEFATATEERKEKEIVKEEIVKEEIVIEEIEEEDQKAELEMRRAISQLRKLESIARKVSHKTESDDAIDVNVVSQSNTAKVDYSDLEEDIKYETVEVDDAVFEEEDDITSTVDTEEDDIKYETVEVDDTIFEEEDDITSTVDTEEDDNASTVPATVEEDDTEAKDTLESKTMRRRALKETSTVDVEADDLDSILDELGEDETITEITIDSKDLKKVTESFKRAGLQVAGIQRK